MKRRDFLKLVATASSSVTLLSCRENENAEERAKKKQRVILARTELEKFDGLTSIHEHLDTREAAEKMLEAMKNAGIQRMNLLGCYPSLLHQKKDVDWNGKAENNTLLVDLAQTYPKHFSAYVLFDGKEPDMIGTLQNHLDNGARGVKMYNGAAGSYRAMPMDHPSLQPFYRFCELHGVPILIHVDRKHLDEYLMVVRDYPAIPWICPHLFVQTNPKRIERLGRILNRFPNIHTDTSFGFEPWMHASLTNLSKSRDQVREIFIEHADQILFGTDIVFSTNKSYRTVEWATNSYLEYRKFLEFDDFNHHVVTDKKVYQAQLHGLALPREVLQKIYVDNAEKLLMRNRARTDRDDLNTVLDDLPESALFDSNGKHALFAVAAVASLSEIENLEPGTAGGPSEIATISPMAQPVARALGIETSTIKTFEDGAEVRNYVSEDQGRVAVIPFAQMEPRLRALPIKGTNPALPRINRCALAGEATRNAYFGDYPLLLPVKVRATDIADFVFDPHEIRTVAVTGTTLFGNGMSENPPAGNPKNVVKEAINLMQSADVSHLSIENMMVSSCKQDLKKWKFCYGPEWYDVLDLLGIDVVELTGNHLKDWKDDIVKSTIQEYRRRGVKIFGGGENITMARKPAIIDVRGLKIGFIGINRVNGERFGATAERTGPLVPRENTEDNFSVALNEAKKHSDVFFLGYQGALEFSPTPMNDMLRHAHMAIKQGAVGAFATHPHMPAGAEVYNGNFVAYGPGNFLFRHPAYTMPKRVLTEYGMVVRYCLYRRKSIQTQLDTIRYENGERLRVLSGAEHKKVINRVRFSSQPGLSPIRSTPYTDSCVEIGAKNEGNYRNIWRVQVRSWITGVLVGIAPKSLRDFHSPDEELELLEQVRTKYQRFGGAGLRLAHVFRDSDKLENIHKYDALRLYLTSIDEKKTNLLSSIAVTQKPIQIVFDRNIEFSAMLSLLERVKNPTVILSGFLTRNPDMRKEIGNLLLERRGLYFDTSAQSHREYKGWFNSLERDHNEWRKFFIANKERILTGTGTSHFKSRLSWSNYNRVLRSIHWALQEKTYIQHSIKDGNKGEWGSYNYDDEKRVSGLDLPIEVVDAIMSKNFHRIWKGQESNK